MAATNRPDVLDAALLRPGRFDRQISIDRPDIKGRQQIFDVHLKPITILTEGTLAVNSKKLAQQTPGFAGAEIANVCNEAALIAARRNKKAIDMDDFHFAIDRVIGGLEKKNKIISPLEKKVIAYHEAGHAVIGWFLEHTDPLVKVTIVPRGVAALGFAQYLPKENYIVTTQQMQDRMCMALGGRAAELAIYNHLSTGAQSDLDMVTKMAYAMVSVYGMSEKIGNVSFHGMGDEYGMQKPYSDETAKIIDEEARDIILLQMQRASTMLVEKADALESIAQELLLKEILYSDDLERLIGKSPYDKRMIYDDAEVEKKIEG
jgi:cell division protease FtsH